MDAASDISKLEQESIYFRIVEDDLIVKEILISFYQTTNTKAATLFDIVNDALVRYVLEIHRLRVSVTMAHQI